MINNYKVHEPFAHERISIQFKPDTATYISTATQTRKHSFIIWMGKRGSWIETNIRALTMLLFVHSSGSNTQLHYRWPHNLGSSFWECISECCESEVWMSDICLFLLELCKYQYVYFRGSIINDNGHNIARKHLLLLARIYITEYWCSSIG